MTFNVYCFFTGVAFDVGLYYDNYKPFKPSPPDYTQGYGHNTGIKGVHNDYGYGYGNLKGYQGGYNDYGNLKGEIGYGISKGVKGPYIGYDHLKGIYGYGHGNLQSYGNYNGYGNHHGYNNGGYGNLKGELGYEYGFAKTPLTNAYYGNKGINNFGNLDQKGHGIYGSGEKYGCKCNHYYHPSYGQGFIDHYHHHHGHK